MTRKLVWWIVGTLTTTTLLLGGSWAKNLQSEVSRIGVLQQDRGERIRYLESAHESLIDRLTHIDKQLDRLEAKVDRLGARARGSTNFAR